MPKAQAMIRRTSDQPTVPSGSYEVREGCLLTLLFMNPGVTLKSRGADKRRSYWEWCLFNVSVL